MRMEMHFPGSCRECGGKIKVGEPVEWARDEGTTCWPCFEKAVASWWDGLTRKNRRMALLALLKPQETETVMKLGRFTYAKHPSPVTIQRAFRMLSGTVAFFMAEIAQPNLEDNMVTDELLKGLAAAVEISTETGDAQALTSARRRALTELGKLPDLREGMTYDDALAALQTTRDEVLASRPDAAVKIAEPEATIEDVCDVIAEAGPEGPPPAPKSADDGAIEGKPLDLDKEDDSWLADW